jgi:hypothetical protein
VCLRGIITCRCSFSLLHFSLSLSRDLATVVDNASVLKCIDIHKVSLSKAYHIAYPGDTSLDEENQAWADYFSSYITSGEDPMEPLSDMYYPMVEDLLDWRNVRDHPDYDPSQHKIAGIMSQSFYWRDMIKNILPQGSDGILAVFESPCNPTFTYEINGPTVKYLGVGNVHDSGYDHLEKSSLLQDLDKYSVGKSSYSYIPLEQDSCPWTVRVYPAVAFVESYTSNMPIIFTVVVLLVFGFSSGIFLMYDWYVRRRQRIVMASAVRSNKVRIGGDVFSDYTSRHLFSLQSLNSLLRLLLRCSHPPFAIVSLRRRRLHQTNSKMN